MTESNPLLATIQKKISDLDTFFWDCATALTVNSVSGDYVEFGSWGGNTLRLGYERLAPAGRHLWAFDSFEGLPEAADPRDRHPGWASTTAGQGGVDAFHAECRRHGIPPDAYTAVAGYYDEVLPRLGPGDAPSDIAMVYLDCNLYSSTVTALEFLSPRLKPGMIIAFDDYWCWGSDGISGERSAFNEFQATHREWGFVRFKDAGWGGLSFVVERPGHGPG